VTLHNGAVVTLVMNHAGIITRVAPHRIIAIASVKPVGTVPTLPTTTELC